MQICFIDDREENREGWMKGFGPEVSTECDLRTFASAADWYRGDIWVMDVVTDESE